MTQTAMRMQCLISKLGHFKQNCFVVVVCRLWRVKERHFYLFIYFWLTAHDCFVSCFGITPFMKMHAVGWEFEKVMNDFSCSNERKFFYFYALLFTAVNARLWGSCDPGGLGLICRSVWHVLPTEQQKDLLCFCFMAVSPHVLGIVYDAVVLR